VEDEREVSESDETMLGRKGLWMSSSRAVRTFSNSESGSLAQNSFVGGGSVYFCSDLVVHFQAFAESYRERNLGKEQRQ